MLEKIDIRKLKNYPALDKRFLGLQFDSKNEDSVPYMGGTFGILYNTKKVTDPVSSWAILWNPKYGKQILMMDSVRDCLAVAFLRLGYSLNSTAIPKSAEHKEEALQFIDFLNRPEIAKRNVEFIGYATPHGKAFERLPP